MLHMEYGSLLRCVVMEFINIYKMIKIVCFIIGFVIFGVGFILDNWAWWFRKMFNIHFFVLVVTKSNFGGTGSFVWEHLSWFICDIKKLTHFQSISDEIMLQFITTSYFLFHTRPSNWSSCNSLTLKVITTTLNLIFKCLFR